MITLILTVLCQGPLPTYTSHAETTTADYEQDLQLVRMGWYDSYNNRRCKAVRVKVSKSWIVSKRYLSLSSRC